MDKYIQFQSFNHVYSVYNNNTDYTSVTSFIHKFFPPFIEDEVIGKMTNSICNPSSEYYLKTPDEIKAMWMFKRNQGTFMHLCIEHILMGVLQSEHTMLQYMPVEYAYFNQFHQKIKSEGFQPYRLEWRIFDEKYKICGSVDALFIKDNEISMFDWKRSKEIRKYSNEMGFAPLDHVPNCNYYTYSLQLNLYKYIIESNYGLRIKDMFMVIIHPNQPNYQMVPIEVMQPTIKTMLKHNRDMALDLQLLSVDEEGS